MGAPCYRNLGRLEISRYGADGRDLKGEIISGSEGTAPLARVRKFPKARAGHTARGLLRF